MRPGETPVPIPNTTVKAWAADGTALETMWESRRAPDQKNILPVMRAYKLPRGKAAGGKLLTGPDD